MTFSRSQSINDPFQSICLASWLNPQVTCLQTGVPPCSVLAMPDHFRRLHPSDVVFLTFYHLTFLYFVYTICRTVFSLLRGDYGNLPLLYRI